jgi:hypothetical protein
MGVHLRFDKNKNLFLTFICIISQMMNPAETQSKDLWRRKDGYVRGICLSVICANVILLCLFGFMLAISLMKIEGDNNTHQKWNKNIDCGNCKTYVSNPLYPEKYGHNCYCCGSNSEANVCWIGITHIPCNSTELIHQCESNKATFLQNWKVRDPMQSLMTIMIIVFGGICLIAIVLVLIYYVNRPKPINYNSV